MVVDVMLMSIDMPSTGIKTKNTVVDKNLSHNNKKRTDVNGKKTFVVALLPPLLLIKSGVDTLQTVVKRALTAVKNLMLRSKSGVKSSF